MQVLIPELAALCLWGAVWLSVRSSDSLVIYLPYLTGQSLLKLRLNVAGELFLAVRIFYE